jgi:hypothetical protein
MAVPVRFILCSGPSQNARDIRLIRKNRRPGDTVCAVNNQIFWAPWADILYACDKGWWKEYGRRVRHLDCRKVSLMGASKNFGATEIYRCGKQTGLGEKHIHTGGNSGYQAINLAYLDGCKEIVLTGLDCARTYGKYHCHENHPAHKKLGNPTDDVIRVWLQRFPTLAKLLAEKGVRVINCSRHTALQCFERMTLEQYFAQRP